VSGPPSRMRSALTVAGRVAGVALGACALILALALITVATAPRGARTAFHDCAERARADGLALEAARGLCSDRTQRSLENPAIDGTAGYRTHAFDDQVEFGGTIENLTPGKIITSATVRVAHADGGGVEDAKTFDHLWIEPRAKGSFRLSPPDLTFIPRGDRLDQSAVPGETLFRWRIDAIKGIDTGY